MARDSEEEHRIKRPPVHALGEDLETFSVNELQERIDLLRNEIRRLEEAVRAKQASRDAADSFFRS